MGAFESLAARLASALRPFAFAMQSEDDIRNVIAYLGWTLPTMPPSLLALGGDLNELTRALADLTNALDASESGDEGASNVDAAMGNLTLNLAAVIAGLHGLPEHLRAELPADFITATHIDRELESRIFDWLVSKGLSSASPVLYHVLRVAGVIEVDGENIAPDRFAPAFERHRIRWDRLFRLFDPVSLAREVYGWGTPRIDTERLFKDCVPLSFALSMPAEFRYATAAFVQHTAPGADPDLDPTPQLWVPVFRSDEASFFLVCAALPKTSASEPQGLAIGVVPSTGADVSTSLGDGLDLTVSATAQVGTGAALVLRPDRSPEFVLDMDGSTGSALTTGRVAATVTWRAADGEQPQGMSSAEGTQLTAQSVSIGLVAEATPADTNVFVEIKIDHGKLTIASNNDDGLLSSILPAEGMSVPFALALRWSRAGLHFQGSAALATTLPLNVAFGPLMLRSLNLAIKTEAGQVAGTAAVTGTINVGPVALSIQEIGLTAATRTGPGNLGPVDVDVGFKPPTGIGISIDAQGVLTGGGFLFHDKATQVYAGVMQLSLHERITLKAFGLIATRMPDGGKGYSLVVFITAEDFKPIPLGMGLTLQGIGGMVAIHRTFNETAMREGLKNNALGLLLFPKDPIRNAPEIIRNLATIFPPKQGSYLFGILAKIGWFSPTLVTLDLALILEFGARRRLIVLGRIQALLPSRENALIQLNLDSMGLIDFDEGKAEIDAVLVDSRLAHKFVLTGSMALRARWTSGPGRGFALAVGGFNPHFAPPPGMPKLDRIAIALAAGDNPRLTCEAYFAITSNTIQYGARAQLYAAAFGFSVQGDVGYDVLVQLSPFHFLADFQASLQLKRGSRNLFKVSLKGALAGPRPLRVSGKATFEIFWCDFSIRFDKTLVAGEKPPPPPAVDVLAELKRALGMAESWSTQRAPNRQHGVALRKLAPGLAVVLDPLGNLAVKQQVVPLNTARDIDTFGGAPVAGARRFQIGATLSGQPQHIDVLREAFAPAQFFAMSDDEKLASPSFEDMDAGLVFGSSAVVFAESQAVAAPLEYETIVIDDEAPADVPPKTPPAERYPLSAERLLLHARFGAVARAPIRNLGLGRFRNADAPQAATLHTPQWVVASVVDSNTIAAGSEPGASWSANRATMTLLNRQAGGAQHWQLIPRHEVPA